MSDVRLPRMSEYRGAGRVVHTPETRYVGDNKLAKFTIAVDQFKNKEKSTMFLDCVAWGRTAESAAEMGKGEPVIVEGTLSSRKYTGKDGNPRTAFEVTVNRIHRLAWPEEGSAGAPQVSSPPPDQDDEDLPF